MLNEHCIKSTSDVFQSMQRLVYHKSESEGRCLRLINFVSIVVKEYTQLAGPVSSYGGVSINTFYIQNVYKMCLLQAQLYFYI